jgi:hypothetical protein
MNFKEAVLAYRAAVKGRAGTGAGKPSPSRSNEARGIWFLRARNGDQVARVSKAGVRLAGANRFAVRTEQAARPRRRRR